MAYLLGRMVWVTWRGGPERVARRSGRCGCSRPGPSSSRAFAIGLNLRDSNVIDVGYSGVIGAERIVHGEMPYGHMPKEGALKPCGPADAEGEIRERIQTNGRCESANERGDTYGPAAYEAYIPGYAVFGWSGKWDRLPAAHATSVLFDLLALLGLALVGRRFGGARLAAMLSVRLGRLSVHAVRVELEHERRDHARIPDLRLLARDVRLRAWGVRRARRGGRSSRALLARAPLGGLPGVAAAARGKGLFAGGFAVATAAAFSILLLEPSPAHAARVFWDRTFGWQVGRDSPFSIWGWGQYHAAGIPDLGSCSTALGLLVAGAIACYFVPAAEDGAPARRAHGGHADRLRARADPLVLPLHPVVLPLRRVRRAGRPPASVEAPPAHDDAERELVATG